MNSTTLYKGIDLSEQQIIDCSKPQGNQGCGGGWMPLVFDYVIKYGSTGESSYPYTASAGSCKTNGGQFSIKSYQGGALSNCTMLSAMIVGRPVSIAVSAGNKYWQYYSGGILTECGSGNVDHGVMLVGVYQDHTENYWKIKNSWSTTWGEKGYIRINRGTDNLCKICSYGYYPVLWYDIVCDLNISITISIEYPWINTNFKVSPCCDVFEVTPIVSKMQRVKCGWLSRRLWF